MDHGKATEDMVQELCRRSFLADFVVRSPKFVTPSGYSREAGDLLLPLKDTLIAIQIRSRQIDSSFDPSNQVDLERISKRIHRAIEQVKTAKRALENGSLHHIDNLRGIRLPVRASTYSKHIGVVVLDLPTSSQSSSDLDLLIMNTLKMLRNIPVHVFLRSDFEAILLEMDTLPDFLRYLNVRAHLMLNGILAPFTQELDLLALVQTRYPEVERILAGSADRVVIQPGMWEHYRKQYKEELEDRDNRRRPGRIVDALIEEVHKCIGYCDSEHDGEFRPATAEDYVAISHEIASLSRVHRNSLGSRMLEKVKRADTDPKGFSYFGYVADELETGFVFLSSRENRQISRRMLMNISSAFCLRMNLKRVVGIGTQNLSAKKHAHDFLFWEDVQFSERETLEKLGDKIFGSRIDMTTDEWGNTRKRDPLRRPGN